jgi:hypothetical protein
MGSPDVYDEEVLRALQSSGTRVLLIGRRALVALGAPVMTADYDVWVHRDDVERLNHAFAKIDHFPNHPPDAARARGRYVLENDQHIDVMIARAKGTEDGTTLTFDDAWAARQSLEIAPGITAALPSIEHLIITKRWALRPRDLVDIEWLTLFAKKSS